jgi:hypothetical protein
MTSDDTAKGAVDPVTDCAAQASTGMHSFDSFQVSLLLPMNQQLQGG